MFITTDAPEGKPVQLASDVDGDGVHTLTVKGSGGLPDGASTEANQAALLASLGEPSDAPWDGVSAEATVISLLKALVLAQPAQG